MPLDRRVRLVRAAIVLLAALALTMVAALAFVIVRDRSETTRTTARYDPPVWAGQNVPNACSGGFYARHEATIVLTIVSHCAVPGTTLHDPAGVTLGTFGPMPQLEACPEGRLCLSSDFLTLALTADHIPWGHLNEVDMGAGGYRTIDPGTRPLACADIAVGGTVEVDGREHFRSGSVVEVGSYEHETDVMFPCMVVTDIAVFVGDSGGAVLVDGLPAGVISRRIGDRLGFTPLAEGLADLGLILCTTPDCDLSPATAVQPPSD